MTHLLLTVSYPISPPPKPELDQALFTILVPVGVDPEQSTKLIYPVADGPL